MTAHARDILKLGPTLITQRQLPEIGKSDSPRFDCIINRFADLTPPRKMNYFSQLCFFRIKLQYLIARNLIDVLARNLRYNLSNVSVLVNEIFHFVNI